MSTPTLLFADKSTLCSPFSTLHQLRKMMFNKASHGFKHFAASCCFIRPDYNMVRTTETRNYLCFRFEGSYAYIPQEAVIC